MQKIIYLIWLWYFYCVFNIKKVLLFYQFLRNLLAKQMFDLFCVYFNCLRIDYNCSESNCITQFARGKADIMLNNSNAQKGSARSKWHFYPAIVSSLMVLSKEMDCDRLSLHSAWHPKAEGRTGIIYNRECSY